MKRSPIRKVSQRGALRKEIGRLQFELLKQKRGPKCEICGKSSPVGRFHILATGSHPRLEFVEENILLACWMPCHYGWHHYGPIDSRNAKIVARIIELRGERYLEDLYGIERYMSQHNRLYLLARKQELIQEMRGR